MSVEVPGQYYSGEDYEEDEPQEYEGGTHLEQPVRVVSVTENYAPEYASCMTWPIPVQGIGQPLLIAPRRIRRSECKVQLNFTVAGTVILNSNLQGVMNGQGLQIVMPVAGLYTAPDWESQQPLYAIASIAGISAIVLDESYASR